MDFNFLFNNNSFNDKMQSVYYLRFISFQIWKFLLLFIFLFILFYLTHFWPFSFFSVLNFKFLSYIQIYFFLIFIDFLQMELFIQSNSQYSFFEIMIKIFLIPNKTTFSIFAITFLNYINLNILKSMSYSIDNYIFYLENDNFNSNFILMIMSALFSIKSISSKELFKWNEIEVKFIIYFI